MNQTILNHYNESLRVYRLLINFLPEIEEISKLLFNNLYTLKLSL